MEFIYYILIVELFLLSFVLIYLLLVGFELTVERKDKLSDIIITFKINNFRKQWNRLKESWEIYKKMRDELY